MRRYDSIIHRYVRKHKLKGYNFSSAETKSNELHIRYHNYHHHFLYQVTSSPNFAHITPKFTSLFSYIIKNAMFTEIQGELRCKICYYGNRHWNMTMPMHFYTIKCKIQYWSFLYSTTVFTASINCWIYFRTKHSIS